MPRTASAQRTHVPSLRAGTSAPPTFDLARFAASQTEWASEQWSRTAQTCSGLLSALFDAQAACWRGTEACMCVGLQPWVADDPGPLAVESTLEAPNDLSPPALVRRATTAWLILGQACMNALEHDLQEAGSGQAVAARPRRSSSRATA